MSNIVALKYMSDVPGVRITMDILNELASTVDYQDKVYKFKDFQEVLYYYDTAAYIFYL